MRTSDQRNVLIIQAMMKQYRVPFFEKLYHSLRREGISLKVAYGSPPAGELKKGDNVALNPRFGVRVDNIWMLKDKLLYQPLAGEIMDADLVVVEQANKHLINYLLLALSALGFRKMAFWGHGRNLRAKRPGLSEWAKRKMCKMPDWWFAYTRGTAAYLARQGVAEEKITVVMNSMDTAGFRNDLASVSEGVIRAEKGELGIAAGARVGLFCGSLYGDKRLDFLFNSARMIKERVPEFELLIVGGGPDSGLAERVARNLRWVHYAGPLFGVRKAVYFRMAEFFLHPGALGLAILDAFAAGLPVLTTENPMHGPEIEYLEDGVNGIIAPFELRTFSDRVVNLLKDGESCARMRRSAAEGACRYGIDDMVKNFKAGIVECLASGPAPWRARRRGSIGPYEETS